MGSLHERLTRLRDDRGMGLAELLVVISLLTVVMVMVTGFYVSAMRTVDLTRGLTDSTKSVSNAMSAVSRAIRAGTSNPVAGNAIPDPAFVVAKNDDIVFYAYVNLVDATETPVMYRFHVDPDTGKLYETQWPATALPNGRWSFPSLSSTPTYTRVITETIAPFAAGEVDHPFTFIRANRTAFAPNPAGLSAAERQLVVAVRVNLSVQGSLTDDRHRVTLVNLVGMPNLGFGAED